VIPTYNGWYPMIDPDTEKVQLRRVSGVDDGGGVHGDDNDDVEAQQPRKSKRSHHHPAYTSSVDRTGEWNRYSRRTRAENLDAIRKKRVKKKRKLAGLTTTGWEIMGPTDAFDYPVVPKVDAFAQVSVGRRASLAEIFLTAFSLETVQKMYSLRPVDSFTRQQAYPRPPTVWNPTGQQR